MNKLRRLIFGLPTPEWVTPPEPTFEQVEAKYHGDRLSIQEDLQRALERIKIEEMEIRFNHDKQLARLTYDFELWQKQHPKIEAGIETFTFSYSPLNPLDDIRHATIYETEFKAGE